MTERQMYFAAKVGKYVWECAWFVFLFTIGARAIYGDWWWTV